VDEGSRGLVADVLDFAGDVELSVTETCVMAADAATAGASPTGSDHFKL
jgi:hypothetical protein